MDPYAHANYSSPSGGLLDFSAQTATSTAVNTPASMAYTFRVGESSPRTTSTLCSPSSANDNDNTFCNDHVSASTPPTQTKPLYSPSDFVSLTDEDKTSVVHSLIHTPTFGLNELRKLVTLHLNVSAQHVKGSRMEVSFTLCPWSSSAYNNGPDGNAVLESYKDASQCPDGILVETSKANETHFQKTATHDGIVWSVFVFPSGFLQHAQSYEWSTSGPPVNTDARQFADNVTQALDATFERHAKKLNKSFKPNANGPENTMFVFAKRSVFVPSPAPLDEGRASDYNDPFSVLGKFPDFKFNRIPEVLVIDHAHKRSVPMSFHHLHLLERSVVLQVVTEPRAFVHKGSLGWDYRLTCIKVLGKKDFALAISPSKMVQKRQQYFLDDDDGDDDGQPQDKRPRTA